MFVRKFGVLFTSPFPSPVLCGRPIWNLPRRNIEEDVQRKEGLERRNESVADFPPLLQRPVHHQHRELDGVAAEGRALAQSLRLHPRGLPRAQRRPRLQRGHGRTQTGQSVSCSLIMSLGPYSKVHTSMREVA